MKATLLKVRYINGEDWSHKTYMSGSMSEIESFYKFLVYQRKNAPDVIGFTKHSAEHPIQFTFTGEDFKEEWVLYYELYGNVQS